MNWGREKACIKTSLSFREMSHVTPWLQKLELDSGIEVVHVFFGRLLGLPGRFRWPPQLGDRLRWATEGFVLPGAVGPPCGPISSYEGQSSRGEAKIQSPSPPDIDKRSATVIRAIFEGPKSLESKLLEVERPRRLRPFHLVLAEPQRGALVCFLDLGTRLTKTLQGAGTGKQSVSFTEKELDDICTLVMQQTVLPSEAPKSCIDVASTPVAVPLLPVEACLLPGNASVERTCIEGPERMALPGLIAFSSAGDDRDAGFKSIASGQTRRKPDRTRRGARSKIPN